MAPVILVLGLGLVFVVLPMLFVDARQAPEETGFNWFGALKVLCCIVWLVIPTMFSGARGRHSASYSWTLFTVLALAVNLSRGKRKGTAGPRRQSPPKRSPPKLPAPTIDASTSWPANYVAQWGTPVAEPVKPKQDDAARARQLADEADAYRQAGRIPESIALWRAVVALDPANPNHHLELAAVLDMSGDLRAARGVLLVVLSLSPGDMFATPYLADLDERIARGGR